MSEWQKLGQRPMDSPYAHHPILYVLHGNIFSPSHAVVKAVGNCAKGLPLAHKNQPR